MFTAVHLLWDSKGMFFNSFDDIFEHDFRCESVTVEHNRFIGRSIPTVHYNIIITQYQYQV